MAESVGLLYADHFWGEKHHGFQVLQENLKKSEETVNEVVHFVKDRLAVEDEYVKAVNRSINKINNFISNGSSIEQIWQLTKGTMELLSEIHLMLVRNLQDLSKDVTKYKEEVGRNRKELKQPIVVEAVNLMQTTTTCLQKSKETYHHRCSELEKARKEGSKEIGKIENKVSRAREEYKGYVEKYELIREDFEQKMSESCKKFQTFDRSLYASIQQYILLYSSYSTDMTQASLQVSEQYRESIQHLNADEFVRKFIRTKSTGCEKPAHALFEEPENGGIVKDLVDIISGKSGEEDGGGEKKGPAANKLSMFINKRRKTVSTSSVDEAAQNEGFSASGLFNKLSRRSKKESGMMEDAQSTASSSKSDERVLNGNINPLDATIKQEEPIVDDEGFIIRNSSSSAVQAENTNWSSCSSDEDNDEEDENELQASKIRALTIKPADRAVQMNASVDELRNAIGSISLTKSTTFDRDPWTIGGSRPPSFSQSMNVSSLRQPLRSHHTADGRFRTSTRGEESAAPPFSVSMGSGGIARARPRSNTPTFSMTQRKDSFADPWSSSFNLAPSDSLGESMFNLSQSTGNLMQATISEQRIPVAMAINEYSHVWFKKADMTEFVQRIFGTVMISFPSSSITLLTSVQNEIEPLGFSLRNTENIKAVLPNKHLIDESSSGKLDDGSRTFYFSKSALANWLTAQQKQKPDAAFINAEVARYELDADSPSNIQPPLFFSAYWKFEQGHTDLRVDYRMNTDSMIVGPILNLHVSTTINGKIERCTCDPEAKWIPETSNLSWNILEISRNGEVGGSLKARAYMRSCDEEEVSLEMINRKPAQVFAQFQCHDTSFSGVELSLVPSDIYHLSMLRRKVLAGKYFCDPELRK